MKKVLLTGCAGFIGSHLAERLLADGWAVTGIDNFSNFYPRRLKEQNLSELKKNENFSFVEADICDSSTFEQLQDTFELVVHLAAKAGVRPSIANPSAYIDTNLGGTQQVLEFMRKQNIKKLAFGSSSSVYGNHKQVPYHEDLEVGRPISPYAFTKRANELQCHTYHHLYNIDCICFRFFTVYGPRQRPDLAIRKFVKLLSAGEPIEMYGDGSTSRDYTYVSDIVQGLTQGINYLLQHQQVYEIVNLGNHTPVKLSTLIETLAHLLAVPLHLHQLPKQPGDVDITFADISKAKQLFGYKPTTSLPTGLQHFIEWYKERQ